jgi:hypothetical protein
MRITNRESHSGLLRKTLATTLLAAAFTACADATRTVDVPVNTQVYSTLVAQGEPPPRAAAGEIAYLFARALADDDLRRRVKNALRDSPMREHKLELSAFLAGATGADLVRGVESKTGTQRAHLLNRLRALPPLEFYMPVAEHRMSWKGEANVIVATAPDDDASPIGFDLTGQPVALTQSDPPNRPVLVLVPQETDFTRTASAAELASRGNPNRETIESPTPVRAGVLANCAPNAKSCDPGQSPGGGLPDGLYISFQRLTDMGEPWTMGAPEIEVHLHGAPTSGVTWGADLSCSGDGQPYPRGFNQDNGFWNGLALIADVNQIAAQQAASPNGYNIVVWEDDSEKCNLHPPTNFDVQAAIRTAVQIAAGLGAIKFTGGPAAIAVAIGTFLGTAYQLLAPHVNDDDYIGTYIPQSQTSYVFTDANWILYSSNGSMTGRAKFEMKDY